jgi:hypothetical protein
MIQIRRAHPTDFVKERDDMANGDNSIQNAVKLAGEAFIPGGSNLINGDIKQGAIHAILGIAARAAFGLPGLLIVCANSYSKATTGQHLTESLRGGQTAEKDAL